MTTFAGGRIVTPSGVLDPGWVTVDEGIIVGLGEGAPPAEASVTDLGGSWLVPGFVDVHVHGGGGHTVTTGDPAEAAEALAFHRAHGTTTSLLSLVTAPVDMLCGAVERLAGLVEGDHRPDGSPGSIAGIHLEGPFLSVDACGAQDPKWMRAPDRASVDRLIESGRGTVRMVTVAPELQGGLAAVEQLVVWGVVVAVGHTRAVHELAEAAFDAGATVATHLFNCMGAFHHRDPGTVGAALADDRVTAELILDGHHVHPTTARIAIGAKTSSRVALITDAIALAGVGDGDIDLGTVRLQVRDGVARISDPPPGIEGGGSVASDASPARPGGAAGDDEALPLATDVEGVDAGAIAGLAAGEGIEDKADDADGLGALAGSTLTMDQAFRMAVSIGSAVAEASEMASAVPARVLGLDGTRGTIEVGKHADLVVLDGDLEVVAVYAYGSPVA